MFVAVCYCHLKITIILGKKGRRIASWAVAGPAVELLWCSGPCCTKLLPAPFLFFSLFSFFPFPFRALLKLKTYLRKYHASHRHCYETARTNLRGIYFSRIYSFKLKVIWLETKNLLHLAWSKWIWKLFQLLSMGLWECCQFKWSIRPRGQVSIDYNTSLAQLEHWILHLRGMHAETSMKGRALPKKWKDGCVLTYCQFDLAALTRSWSLHDQ